jgi:hypothetical protein
MNNYSPSLSFLVSLFLFGTRTTVRPKAKSDCSNSFKYKYLSWAGGYVVMGMVCLAVMLAGKPTGRLTGDWATGTSFHVHGKRFQFRHHGHSYKLAVIIPIMILRESRPLLVKPSEWHHMYESSNYNPSMLS